MADILKSPIVLGLLAAATTYAYMYWEQENKYKKDPSLPKKPISIWTPGIIGIVVWFCATSFMGESVPVMEEIPVYQGKKALRGTLSKEGGNSLSYHLMKDKNIKLPNMDVFIDLAQF